MADGIGQKVDITSDAGRRRICAFGKGARRLGATLVETGTCRREVDVGLLTWALESSIDATVFGDRRAVVNINFADQPAGEALWWFVNQNGTCELHVTDPGFEIDLFLACTLADMIYIYRGDTSLARALAADRLEAIGSTSARKRLAAWLNLGPLSRVESQRSETSTLEPMAPARL